VGLGEQEACLASRGSVPAKSSRVTRRAQPLAWKAQFEIEDLDADGTTDGLTGKSRGWYCLRAEAEHRGERRK
jgi:hypothetical protein